MSFVRVGEAQFDRPSRSSTTRRRPATRFDAEGTPTPADALVEAGTTASLTHDLRTAAAAGAESTGHGVGAPSFGALARHLCLAPSDAGDRCGSRGRRPDRRRRSGRAGRRSRAGHPRDRPLVHARARPAHAGGHRPDPQRRVAGRGRRGRAGRCATSGSRSRTPQALMPGSVRGVGRVAHAVPGDTYSAVRAALDGAGAAPGVMELHRRRQRLAARATARRVQRGCETTAKCSDRRRRGEDGDVAGGASAASCHPPNANAQLRRPTSSRAAPSTTTITRRAARRRPPATSTGRQLAPAPGRDGVARRRVARRAPWRAAEPPRPARSRRRRGSRCSRRGGTSRRADGLRPAQRRHRGRRSESSGVAPPAGAATPRNDVRHTIHSGLPWWRTTPP